MFKSLFICVFFLITISAYAQLSISGTIVSENNEIVRDAHLKLESDLFKKEIISNHNGEFIFNNLKDGSYTLIVKKNNRKDIYHFILRGENIVEKIILNTSSIDLKTVNISRIKSVKNELEKEGFAMNVIETEEAGTRNIQTNELLDRTVGVRVRQNGGLGARVDYNLNGMSGNSIRIFIDGLPISTYGTSFDLNSIPPALIEQIEVYKGVVPAHLADDALGGAINVILKKGARNTINASTSYGSFNTTQSNIFALYRAKNGFTTKLNSFLNYSDNDYKVWGDHVYNILPNGRHEYIKARRFNDKYKSLGARLELGYTDVKWADQFLFSYNYSQDYKQAQHGQYMTKPYKGRFTEGDSHVMGFNYRKKDLFFKGLEFDVNAIYTKSKHTTNDTVKYNYNWNGEIATGLDGKPILSPNGAQQGAPTINHIKRDILSLRGGLKYEINSNHKLLVNTLFYDTKRTDNDVLKSVLERTFLGNRDLQKTVTSFAYEMRAFNSKFKLNAFTKLYHQKIHKMDPKLVTNSNGIQERVEEHTNNSRNITGYGFATSYLITPAIVVLASAEKAVRMPTENEIFGDPSENMESNIGIRPETSNNYNLGLKVGPYKIAEHTFSVGGSGFLRDSKDKIVRRINDRNNDAVQTLPFENLGKAQSIGFEAELAYQYGKNLNVVLNMSKFNSLYKLKYDANGNVLDRYNQQLPNEPFFTANGNVQYRFKDVFLKGSGLNLNYNFGYVQSFKTNWLKIFGTETPDQFIQDIGFSYIFPKKKFILSFDARNIFNQQAFDNYAVQKPGRAFYLKLNYTFNKF